MQATPVSLLTLAIFALAFSSGLGFFGCLFLLTRHLDMGWVQSGLSFHLETKHLPRLAKLLGGFEKAPDAPTGRLLWIARGLWVSMTVLLLVFVLMLSGAV